MNERELAIVPVASDLTGRWILVALNSEPAMLGHRVEFMFHDDGGMLCVEIVPHRPVDGSMRVEADFHGSVLKLRMRTEMPWLEMVWLNGRFEGGFVDTASGQRSGIPLKLIRSDHLHTGVAGSSLDSD